MDNRFEDALAEAREVDAHLQSLSPEEKNALFKEKPYLGVPFTIKDCFTVKGLCWTAGLWYRRHEKVAWVLTIIGIIITIIGIVPKF